MQKSKWMVVVKKTKELDCLLLEQLRYAGVVGVKNDSIEIPQIAGVDGSIWSDINARRMQSFGLSAEAKLM